MTLNLNPTARIPPMILVFLIWGAGLGAAAQFGKISVLYEGLRGIYGGGGEAGLGLVVSVVGMVGLIFGTTAGILVQRIGPGRSLLGGLALGALVSMLEAALPAWEVMIALRVLEGLSHLVIVVSGPVMIAALAPERFRPFAMTLWSSFFGVSYAVLATLAPGIIDLGGMPALFLAHAAWMAVLALILWCVLPKDPAAPTVPMGNLLAAHRRIYASPWLAAPAMGFCFYTFLYVACLTLLPPAVPEAQRALMAAGMPLVSILVSLSLGVALLGRIPAIRIVQAGYLFAVPGFLLLIPFWGSGWGMVLAGFWISAALGVVQGASFASIPELNEAPEDRAAASGAVAQLGNLGTTTGTPVLAALLAWGGAGPMVLLALICCMAGVLIHQWQAVRRRNRLA